MDINEQKERALRCAKASPEAAGRRDRAGWLALFAEDAAVEDPVGTPPNRRNQRCDGRSGRSGGDQRDELEQFYDVFIAPNHIWFEERRDVVLGCLVARDVVIHMEMSTGLKSSVPAYLLYELREKEGALQIVRLQAYWEASRASKKIVAQGWRGWRTVLASSARLLKHVGFERTRAYIQGTSQGVRGEGRKMVKRFADVVQAADTSTTTSIMSMFKDDNVHIEWPAGARVELHTFIEQARTLKVKEPRASGWTVGAGYAVNNTGNASDIEGIAFFDVDPATSQLVRVRFFHDVA